MLDTDTETETETPGTRWRPKLPARRKVVGRPGAGGGVVPAGSGGRAGRVRRAEGDDKGTYDVRNSWQVVVGSLLIPLGVVLILLAWNGAAHAKVEQQQIPYLISGGFIGLGCMIVGGLFYWGHWLYRVFDQQDLHHKEQQEMMRELLRALGSPTRGAAGNGAVVGGPADWPPPSEGATAVDERFYATTSGTVYHRADCPVIAHHPTDLRVLGRDGLAGLRPCQICSP
jgi:hypothetical protein